MRLNEWRSFSIRPPKVKIESRDESNSTTADVLGEVDKKGENSLEWIRDNREEAVEALGLQVGVSYFSPHDFEGGWARYIKISDMRIPERMACDARKRKWNKKTDRIIETI